MDITKSQLSAAMSLLGISQADLSDGTGISKPTISNLLASSSKWETKKSTKQKIVNFLRSRGIEFTEHEGVKKTPAITELTGIDGFRLFMNDVYETTRDIGGEIFLFNSKSALWTKYLGKEWYQAHEKRMNLISNKFNFRMIVSDINEKPIFGLAKHRILPIQWTNNVIYGYGNKIGFLDFKDEKITIKVIKDKRIKYNIENMFNAAWQIAAKPSHRS